MSKQMDLDFEAWMRQVDNKIESIAGVTSGDLEDFMYRDAYDDELDPEEVAHDALRNAGWE